MGAEQRGGCGGGTAQLDGGGGTMGEARRTLALYCAPVGGGGGQAHHGPPAGHPHGGGGMGGAHGRTIPPPMARRGEVRDDGRTRGRSGARKKRARDPGRPRFNQIRSLKILMGFRTLCNMPTCLTTIPTPASRFHFRLRCLCLRR